MNRLKAIEEEMAAPTFWQNTQEARKKATEKAGKEKEFKRWKDLEQKFEEVLLMDEMLRQEPDQGLEDEIRGGLDLLEKEIEHLQVERLLSGEKDINNAIVTIHPGAGGTESQDWAQMLMRMYIRWAERRGYKVEVIDLLPGEEAGIKSVTFSVEGPYAYGYLKCEMGVHRLVRISPFDANKRRHTSFASLFTLPEVEDDPEIVLNEKDLKIDTYRASSAGGQHVNKTSSAVRITHLPTGLVVSCQNERSQHQNKAMATKVLKAKLYEMRMHEKEKEINQLTGEKKEIGWGSQIRSYVFQPYQMVKDHRTGLEIGNVSAVMDGEIDPFIEAYLMRRGSGSKSPESLPG
jgi:peptide chain release factor 2